MKFCKCLKKTNHKPYGSRRGLYWCYGCDANKVGDHTHKPIKKSQRQKNKKLISAELKDY